MKQKVSSWKFGSLKDMCAIAGGGVLAEALLPAGALASDVASWPSRALGTLTPMALAMSGVGILVIAMGHSTILAHEWAQRHEKAAIKGMIMGAGAAAICSFFKSLVS